jgi:hypothetical protein
MYRGVPIYSTHLFLLFGFAKKRGVRLIGTWRYDKSEPHGTVAYSF